MNVTPIRRGIAALSVAVGIGLAFVVRPPMMALAPVATSWPDNPVLPGGTAQPAADGAAMLADIRLIALQPVSSMPVGLALGMALLGGALAGVMVLLLVLRLAALNQTQQAIVAQANDAGLNARRLETRARLIDAQSVEALAAQLAADVLCRPVSLRAGLLVADALPAPYFSITDTDGVRYFFTADPGLFRRMRIVRPSDPSRPISSLSTSARADMLAAWESLSALKSLTHIAVPRRADWHVIVFNPNRGEVSLLRRVRTALAARRLRAAAPRPLVAVNAATRGEQRDEAAAGPNSVTVQEQSA